MRARSTNAARLLSCATCAAVLACGHDEGPHPTVHLSIRGNVLTADPVQAPVTGATVGLWQFKGLTSSERIAHTTTDQTGRYQLTYSFTSICDESDPLLHWVEASADGYETATTFSNDDPTLPTWPSNPPIYCTSDPQTIDLVMQPVEALRVITPAAGSVGIRTAIAYQLSPRARAPGSTTPSTSTRSPAANFGPIHTRWSSSR